MTVVRGTTRKTTAKIEHRSPLQTSYRIDSILKKNAAKDTDQNEQDFTLDLTSPRRSPIKSPMRRGKKFNRVVRYDEMNLQTLWSGEMQKGVEGRLA